MKTNLEKFNHYEKLIAERDKQFVASVIETLPTVVYDVQPSGRIQVYDVGEATYSNGLYISFNKRPSKEQVEEIKTHWDNRTPLSKDNIRIHYSYAWSESGSRASSAWKLSDFEKMLNLEHAELKALEINDRIKKEDELLNNGHLRCERCRKVYPQTQKVVSNIIGRGRKQTWNSWKNRWEDKACVSTTPMTFCSGECASHEQMSREG